MANHALQAAARYAVSSPSNPVAGLLKLLALMAYTFGLILFGMVPGMALWGLYEASARRRLLGANLRHNEIHAAESGLHNAGMRWFEAQVWAVVVLSLILAGL